MYYSTYHNFSGSCNARYRQHRSLVILIIPVFPTMLTLRRMQSPEKLAFRDTGVLARISYGDGRTFVNGTIGLGALEFAGFDIPQQGRFPLLGNTRVDFSLLSIHQCHSGEGWFC
jgi:hypothetical protein